MTTTPDIYSALNKLSYGLYLVSSRDGDKFNGQIVNTAFQITASPPKVAVSLNKSNLTHEYVLKSGVFSISVLEKDAPMAFIGLFGFKSGRDTDKFRDTPFKISGGCPAVTRHCLAFLTAKTTAVLDAGTHTLFIGEVTGAETLKEGVPLTYDHYKECKHGKTHKNATTFVPEENKKPIS